MRPGNCGVGIENFHCNWGVWLRSQTEKSFPGQVKMGFTSALSDTGYHCSWGQRGKEESRTNQIALLRHAKKDEVIKCGISKSPSLQEPGPHLLLQGQKGLCTLISVPSISLVVIHAPPHPPRPISLKANPTHHSWIKSLPGSQ